jgi:hypothetical protein
MPSIVSDDVKFRGKWPLQRKINSLEWANVAAEVGQVKLPEAGIHHMNASRVSSEEVIS